MEWLLINPAGTDRWQFPKGHIDPGESSKATAVREVAEECGVRASLIEKIADQKYFFHWDGAKIFKIVTFYLMKYAGGDTNNHDKEVRQAKFFPLKKALTKLTFKGDKEILKKAKEILELKSHQL